MNGNGRAVLPPSAVSPVTLYRQPPPVRRSRLRLAGRVFSWLLVGIATVAAGLGGGIYLFFHEELGTVVAKSPEAKVVQKRLAVPEAGKPATALVIGYDRRFTGPEAGGASRSDTIMLVRADPRTKAISMMSFPRDLTVDIHCAGRTTHRGRINQAFTECGAKGTLQTVKALTGLPINYLVSVNFRGFIKIIDRLGGVWLDVDRRYFNNSGEYSAINLQPGYQELNGYQALAYVRYRHTDSDLYRVARQQLFVRAFKDQLKSAFSPLKLPGVVKDLTRNTEVIVGGSGSLSFRTVLSYAFFAYRLPPGHFFQTKLDNLSEDYAYNIYASTDSMRKAVQEFADPDVASPQKATAVALGLKLKAQAPAPRDTYVTVLNGNGVDGSATLAGGLMHERGYSIVNPSSGTANAPSYDYFETKVYYDASQKGAKAAARKVANLFGSADVAKATPAIESLGNNAMLVVVVGKTFHGSLGSAPVDQTPVRQAPSVAKGTDASLQLLRDRAKKVPFPLLVPTVLERTSWIDRTRPIRLYRIDPDGDHKALRLVYRTGASEYWGVQMTDWEDAPVLTEKNVTRRIAGRTYELHYSGPKLHMVVLRTRKGTYWVTNTVLDSLSNETMIAIAKGLKPIASLK